MNGLSMLWEAVVTDLQMNKDALGIDGAERAYTGKVTTISPPSAAVWLNPLVPSRMSQSGAILFPTDVIIYCVAAPKNREDDAVNAALEIAASILRHLTNREISGVILQQPDNDQPLEIVDRSSTGAVVGVLLKAEVSL